MKDKIWLIPCVRPEEPPALREAGCAGYAPSIELNCGQIAALGGRRELIVYGRIPLMHLRHCPLRAGEAGLKGLRVGGAQVSEKHAGFIVNAGGATCADVLRLMDEVRSRVLAAHGVALEPEIRVVR